MKDQKMDKPVALFDMDNTLFDYLGQLRQDMIAIMSPDELKDIPADLYDESKPYLKARMRLIKKQPGWWRHLPIYQPGWNIYEMAKKVGFQCHVLTKGPQSNPRAWMEKVQCIQDHFEEDDISIDIVGEDKTRTYGRVLVDDYPEYVLGWLSKRPRGLAIIPKHPYNEHVIHPNVVIYDGANYKEVTHALQAAMDRQSGQHWKELIKA